MTCDVWEIVPGLCVYGKVLGPVGNDMYEISFDGIVRTIHASVLRAY